MNASAIPTFPKKTWTTKLDYEDSIMPPALLIIHSNHSYGNPQADFVSSPSKLESCRYGASVSEDMDCSHNMQWNVINSTLAYSYHLFNSLTTQKQAANISLQQSKSVMIRFGLTCKHPRFEVSNRYILNSPKGIAVPAMAYPQSPICTTPSSIQDSYRISKVCTMFSQSQNKGPAACSACNTSQC